MGSARALLGFAGCGFLLTSHWFLAATIRRRYFPAVALAEARLVEFVLTSASILLSALALGSIGLFNAPALIGIAAVAGAVGVFARRSLTEGPPVATAEPERREAVGRAPRYSLPVVGITIALVAVRWTAEALHTLQRGFSHTDELHYHLTLSAYFVQSGRTWPVRFPSVGDGAAYHPANSELLHAVFLAVLGSDFISIFLNLAFAGAALLAGWSLGRWAGNAPAGVVLVGAFLCLPPLVSESGTALNDTMAIALLLASVALLFDPIAREPGRRLVVVAGLAAGLGVGTKLTVLVPVVALVLVTRSWPRTKRLTAAATFVASAGVGGGYWYLRNLLHAGNPVPATEFGPLPSPDFEFQRSVEAPVTDYLTDLEVWRSFFIPALDRFLGPLWPLLLTVAIAAGVLALTRSSKGAGPAWFFLGIAGFVALAGYLATPTAAGGEPGAPVLFGPNLRYAFPGLLLCLFAGLAHPALRRRPGLTLSLATLLLAASNLEVPDRGRAALAVVLVMAAAATTAAAVRTRPPRYAVVPALAVAIVVAMVAQDRYLDRYWTETSPQRWTAYAAMRRVTDSRIGVIGFPQPYPFFGRDLSNDVIVLGDETSEDELAPFDSCDAFWDTVENRRPEIIVVLSGTGFESTAFGKQVVSAPLEWLDDSATRELVRTSDVGIFDVREATRSCDSGAI